MSDITPVSALGGVSAEAGLSVSIAEVGPQGMASLRGDFTESALRGAAEAAFGGAVPDVRRITFAGERALAWMAPDELLLIAPRADIAAALASFAEAAGGAHHMGVDVSDARALFRLTGAGAREVIAKGAPVDLSPQAFGPGDFRRSHLGQVAAAFWMREGDTEVFELACFRSLAGFVFEWLVVAAGEDGAVGHF